MAETENKVPLKDKKRLVKALFSYTPVNIDELQLKINDVLEVIEETEEGWWKGILNGNVGMFPSNFVIELDTVPEELKNHSVNELSPTKIVPKPKNIDLQDSGFKHDLTHPPSTKLDIKSNMSSNSEDVTDSPKNADSLDRKSSSLSKKNVDSTAPRLPPKPVREQARVIYPYTALNEDELSLKEGDIITVISKEVEDKGWWKGELNNKTGVFPDNFVQLIKVEEQKKPERPDKPSTALTSKAGLKSSSDKSAPDFSPKVEKKVIKTPPVKPPPPDIHKKEPERPSPPFPCKKPQVPHPMKKPSRSSLGAKFSGFSPPTPVSTSKPPAPETVPAPVSASPPVLPPASDTKLDVLKIADKFNKEDKKEKEDKSKIADKFNKEDKKEKEDKLKTADKFPKDDKKEKEDKKDKETKKDKDVKDNPDLGFEGLESSGKKLIHLTANRVSKVPNRRPPSHIFLRETEKENGISSDPRRLSEPLLSEMKSILPLGDIELPKTNAFAVNEVKAKVPPSRPLPPSIKANKPVVQGSVILTKTISSEECIVKAPEPIKKPLLPDTSSIPGLDPKMHIKRVDIPSDFKPPSSDKELQELKENVKILMATMVNRNEFNELAKQVKELKENLEKCNSNFKKTVNELKTELEAEKKMRLALEIELQQMKERQTT